MTHFEAAAITAGATVTGLGLIAGGLAYASRWPTSQIFGATLVDAPDADPQCHTVALTYDDGPSERNTEQLLDILSHAGAPATFFLIGNHVRRHPRLARMIVERGHALGNHTDMHPALARKGNGRVRSELERCQSTIADTTGVLPTLFRPPYGSRSPAVLRIARELGLTPVLWNVTARDWAPIGGAAIQKRIDAGIARNRRKGRTSNLLLHDASNVDGMEPLSRIDTLTVTGTLLRCGNLRFVGVGSFAG